MTNYSIWVDYLERDFIVRQLPGFLAGGACGVTTNPAIFKAAFTGSCAYEAQKQQSKLKGKSLYELLAVSDVQAACDALSGVFDGTNGFVSIEVDPAFAHDAASTIEEAKRMYKLIKRENVMIKIPATPAGYIAIKQLVQAGIPVNATLVFALDQTERILKAVHNSTVAVVISVFVSRFDRLIDSKLPAHLQSKTGIYNAAQHYNAIQSAGEKNVRTLFASTGVKGDALPKSYYVSALAAENCVNTAPLEAITAYWADGGAQQPIIPKSILPISHEAISEFQRELSANGIDLQAVCDHLISDALAQFQTAFSDILTRLS